MRVIESIELQHPYLPEQAGNLCFVSSSEHNFNESKGLFFFLITLSPPLKTLFRIMHFFGQMNEFLSILSAPLNVED